MTAKRAHDHVKSTRLASALPEMLLPNFKGKPESQFFSKLDILAIDIIELKVVLNMRGRGTKRRGRKEIYSLAKSLPFRDYRDIWSSLTLNYNEGSMRKGTRFILIQSSFPPDLPWLIGKLAF